MLSFVSISEQPISESSGSLDANAFMIGASATSSAGTLEFIIPASLSIPSVSATVTVTDFDDIDAKANVDTLAAVNASASVGAVEGDAQGTATITGISAATAIGTTTALTTVNIVPTAVTATFTADALGYVAKANITIDAATADADLTVNDLEDEDAQATATITGVSATTATNWDSVITLPVIFLASDFERTRVVNIVPYGNYKVYVTR
jgi:hypothetical protein